MDALSIQGLKVNMQNKRSQLKHPQGKHLAATGPADQATYKRQTPADLAEVADGPPGNRRQQYAAQQMANTAAHELLNAQGGPPGGEQDRRHPTIQEGATKPLKAAEHTQASLAGQQVRPLHHRKSSDRILDIKARHLLAHGQDSPRSKELRSSESPMAAHRKDGTTSHQYGLGRLFSNPDDLPPVCSDEVFLREYKQNKNILKIADHTRNFALIQLAVGRKKKEEKMQ